MLANPNIALFIAALGVIGIYAELCRPGRVVPGIIGGVALLTGIASLTKTGPPSPLWAAVILIPLLVISGGLARIAIRARRNKHRLTEPRT
jgi:membrane-bound serine protease (ClpP class)